VSFRSDAYVVPKGSLSLVNFTDISKPYIAPRPVKVLVADWVPFNTRRPKLSGRNSKPGRVADGVRTGCLFNKVAEGFGVGEREGECAKDGVTNNVGIRVDVIREEVALKGDEVRLKENVTVYVVLDGVRSTVLVMSELRNLERDGDGDCDCDSVEGVWLSDLVTSLLVGEGIVRDGPIGVTDGVRPREADCCRDLVIVGVTDDGVLLIDGEGIFE